MNYNNELHYNLDNIFFKYYEPEKSIEISNNKEITDNDIYTFFNTYISTNKNIMVESLIIQNCYNIYDMTQFLSFFPCIKRLIIRNLPSLKVITYDISTFIYLEEIIIEDCWVIDFVPKNFSLLKNLRRFELSGCDKIERLPCDFSIIQSLNYFKIEHCNKLDVINIPCSKEIEIRNSLQLTKLNICQSNLIQKIRIVNCPKLRKLPTLSRCNNILSIYYRGCNSVTRISKKNINSKKLNKLHILNCEKLKYIPFIIKNKTLEHLHIENCEKINLPFFIICKNLKKIYIKNIRVPFFVMKKKRIFSVNFQHLHTFANMNFSKYTSLKNLYLFDCRLSKCLFKQITNQKAVETITLDTCSNLTLKFDKELHNLKILIIQNCKQVCIMDPLGYYQKLLDSNKVFIDECNIISYHQNK